MCMTEQEVVEVVSGLERRTPWSIEETLAMAHSLSFDAELPFISLRIRGESLVRCQARENHQPPSRGAMAIRRNSSTSFAAGPGSNPSRRRNAVSVRSA